LEDLQIDHSISIDPGRPSVFFRLQLCHILGSVSHSLRVSSVRLTVVLSKDCQYSLVMGIPIFTHLNTPAAA
jgi:hypothetical protein